MKTKIKTKIKKQVVSGKDNKVGEQKQCTANKKSAFTMFWEKYPHGAGEIIDMRAVLK